MANATYYPIFAPFTPYVQGLNISYASVTTIGVAAGNASDANSVNLIQAPLALVINGAANGVNGLDTGALANNTLYYVYIVGDATSTYATCAQISLSATQPYIPFGYNMFRRIGCVLTNGSAQFVDFTQRGAGSARSMFYANAVATNITAGASTTFAAVTASASVPATSAEVFVQAVLTADAGATRTAALRDGASSSTLGQIFMSSPASTVTTASLVCPCGASGDIDYLVSNASAAIALNVTGYLDVL